MIFFFVIVTYYKDGSSRLIRNVAESPSDCTVSHPRSNLHNYYHENPTSHLQLCHLCSTRKVHGANFDRYIARGFRVFYFEPVEANVTVPLNRPRTVPFRSPLLTAYHLHT
jgi:hypothetical protein